MWLPYQFKTCLFTANPFTTHPSEISLFNNALWKILGLILVFSALFYVNKSYADKMFLSVGIPVEGYAPFIIMNNNQPSGILIESLELAAKNLAIEIDYVFVPEKRSNNMLKKYLIDARMESKLWVDNPENYLWSEPVTILEDVLVFHRASAADFESEQGLTGTQIITHLGYSYPGLQPMFEQGIIFRQDFSSEIEMLTTLARPVSGVNRAAVMNKQVAMWLIKSTPKLQNRFLFSKHIVGSAPLQFQFAKTDELTKTVAHLNIELKKLKKSGALAAITTRILE